MTAATTSMVHSPVHYRSAGGYEAIDVIEFYGLAESFHFASAAKYMLRAPKKGKYREDVEKALYYVKRMQDLEEQGEFPLPYPAACDGADEWKSPSQIVEDFDLAGTELGDAVYGLLAMCLAEEVDAHWIDGIISQLEAAIRRWDATQGIERAEAAIAEAQ